jgi:hypothetical protein
MVINGKLTGINISIKGSVEDATRHVATIAPPKT